MERDTDFKERLGEILAFARKNENIIHYNVLADLLKSRDDFPEEQSISKVLKYLKAHGIRIIPSEDEDYPADEIAPDMFIPADVNISQKTINVYNLMERLENDEIDLMPGFQRRGNLWSLEKQSQLIESLMLKIPIPAFYFDVADENKWVVIDGLQRLSAFRNFLVGVKCDKNGKDVRIKEKLVGLQYLRDLNGFTLDELPRQYARRIKETALIAFTVEKGTPDGVVFNIFQRINTGGVELNDQEIRQALYQGPATELIQLLAESEAFLLATQGAISPERMADREYVTRFLAFTLLDYRTEYKGNIDDFLIKAMRLLNACNQERLDEIREDFSSVMETCHRIFGKYAFRRYDIMADWRRGPLNKAIFEMWSVCLHELPREQRSQLEAQAEAIRNGFGNLLKDPKFVADLRSGDASSVARRMAMARNFVKEYL